MCAHYQAVTDLQTLRRQFGVDNSSIEARSDVWPAYSSVFIRRHPYADVGDEAVPERELSLGRFGMIPHWSKDDKISRHTYNARSETVMDKPSFRATALFRWRVFMSPTGEVGGLNPPESSLPTVSRWELRAFGACGALRLVSRSKVSLC